MKKRYYFNFNDIVIRIFIFEVDVVAHIRVMNIDVKHTGHYDSWKIYIEFHTSSQRPPSNDSFTGSKFSEL